jgi:hypothetical protein
MKTIIDYFGVFILVFVAYGGGIGLAYLVGDWTGICIGCSFASVMGYVIGVLDGQRKL